MRPPVLRQWLACEISRKCHRNGPRKARKGVKRQNKVGMAVNRVLPVLISAVASGLAQPASLAPLLARVTDEATAFEHGIVKTLAEETLEQSVVMGPPRLQPRAGQQAAKPPRPRTRKRVIVSEYSVVTLKKSGSKDLVEFRQVISVDGAAIQTQASARHALSTTVLSDGDRARKRMLENFASYGLVDIATDYGLILLAFSKPGLARMQFTEEAETTLEGVAVRSIAWKQTSGVGGELEFHGRQAARLPLSGRLLVRRSDLLPLRVEVWAEDTAGKQKIRDEATVGYLQSGHGFLTPAEVVHRHLVDGNVTAENRYTYKMFRLFQADAEIEYETGSGGKKK